MLTKNKFLAASFLSAALLLCMSACSNADGTPPDSTGISSHETVQPNATTDVVFEGTVPADTASETTAIGETSQTVPTQTNENQTEPTQTGSTAPTEPTQTEPKPTDSIAPQPVINRATAAISAMPKVKYDPSWSKGTAVQLPVEPGQSETAMANQLAAYMRELFTDPQADYTYSLTYAGFDTETGKHIFVMTYSSGAQMSEAAAFDGAAAAAQATQLVMNSTGLSVFGGSDYKVCLAIRDVPHFYGTQEATQCLADAAGREIYTRNLLGEGYTEFCIVYYAEEEASHVFLLYLK